MAQAALPPEIVQSIAISNAKTLGEPPTKGAASIYQSGQCQLHNHSHQPIHIKSIAGGKLTLNPGEPTMIPCDRIPEEIIQNQIQNNMMNSATSTSGVSEIYSQRQ